jgi:hypothetical protein
MLLAILPLALVYPTIFPFENSSSLSFVIDELAFIPFAILPNQDPLAMHLVSFPHAFVDLIIWPDILTQPRYLIILKLACVSGSISKGEHSIAMFLAVLVAALVLGTIWPFFNSSAVLFVFTPLSDVERPIGMLVGAVAMGFVV